MKGLRLSVGLLTVIPVGAIGEVDRRLARTAMLLAPLVGLFLGVVAAAVLVGVRALVPSTLGALLGAVLAVATLAYLTRALHLDGLADTADALGSGRRGDAALEIARRGDVGPFGVVTLVLVLLVQVTALAVAEHLHANGFSVVTVSSVFHPEFMSQASTAALPAYAPIDSKDLLVVLSAINQKLEKHHSGRIGKREPGGKKPLPVTKLRQQPGPLLQTARVDRLDALQPIKKRKGLHPA